MKEQEEMEAHTFQPQIYSTAAYYEQSRMDDDRVNIVERSKAWAENKQRKIEMLKEQYCDKDIDECTFQP